MLHGVISFIADPVSVCMFGVTVSAFILLRALCCFQDQRPWVGCFGTLVAVALFCACSSLAFSQIQRPYCPLGERLHGAAGRILWCAP